MQRPDFVNDQIYHIYNRGVEKRDVFLDDEDKFRFIHDLFEFNDTKSTSTAFGYYFKRNLSQSLEVGLLPKIDLNKPKQRKNLKVRKPRKLLVEILAFCIMPNHYHLLLRQKREKGITEFMRKIGTGYTNYFNQKHERVGSLFQGKFKAVLIKKESQLLWIAHYIHLNPIELYEKSWKEREIKNIDMALDNLHKYRWSSFLDYIGKKNFPSITQREFLLDIFGGEESYKKEISDYLMNFAVDDLDNLKIE